MARLLALEWDAKEARAVIARTRGAAVAIEQAVTIPLPEREAGAAAGHDAEVGRTLSKALAEYGISRSDTLVAVGRSSIELKFLSTPPAPPEELPDMVRFQAMRQFTSLGDDWPLDYVPLEPNADGGNNVLAAAISPELVEQIRQTTSAAGVHLQRLVLRPFAAASLLRGEAADGKCRMVVDLLKDEADLTVLIGPQVIFPRTVRLPPGAEPEILARVLLGEGRRTMIAAQNQLGGRRVEEVVIFGDGLHHSAVKQLLEKELSLPVTLIDPFDRIEWADPARAKRPEYPGTFAPLLGMLLDEAANQPHALDFLHPRKRPPKANRNRLYAIAGGAAAAVLLLGFGFIQWQLWSLDKQIRTLGQQRAQEEKAAKASIKPREDVAAIERFLKSDVTWLDELQNLSEQAPPAESLQVSVLNAQFEQKVGGGKITVEGVADKPETISQLEAAIRDESRKIIPAGKELDNKLAGKLQWKFKEDVIIVPPEEAAAAQAAASRSAAGKSKGPVKKSAPSAKKSASSAAATSTEVAR
jgi:Tfp pilus assembly PilM family ATPase